MKAIRWMLTAAHAVLIFWLSSRVWSGAPAFPFADKLFHLVLYLVLGALCAWSLRATSFRGRAVIAPLGATMAAIYGVTDEFHQSFVAGREASGWDLAADAVGAVLGAWLLVCVANRYRRSNKVGRKEG